MSTAFARFLCFKRIIQEILQQVRADKESPNKKKHRTFIAGGVRPTVTTSFNMLRACGKIAGCLFFPRFVTGCFYEKYMSYIHVIKSK